MPIRHRWLPARGIVLVSTDLHGNGEDFHRLRDLFLAEAESQPEAAYWVILGDAVHAPSDSARRREPNLYDSDDESAEIVEGVLDLQSRHPGRVLYVLGNHDHGPIGGEHTRKFHSDEVTHLEGRLSGQQRESLRRLFLPALLCVVAPCGVLLSHGSPDDTLEDLADLDRIDFPFTWGDGYLSPVLDGFLHSYGQPGEVTARLLARLSTPEVPLRIVVHGHDRDESGYFTEGGNQVCPVLFGARRENKRYLRLDLGRAYRGVEDLAEGREVRRLYSG